MNTYFLLISTPFLGFFSLILLYLLCFLLVKLIYFARIGWHAKNDKKPTPEVKKEKPPEPVYYIVERKKKRPKTAYSEPREFRFK